MGFTIKSGQDLEQAFDTIEQKMAGFDDRIEAAQGSLAESVAIAKETQNQVRDLMQRNLPPGAPTSGLAAFTGEKLTWEAIHKHPTAIRRTDTYSFEKADKDDLIAQFQDAADQLLIVASAMKYVDRSGLPDPQRMQSLKFYRDVYAPLREKVAKAAGDAFSHVAGAGGTSGTEWNPTEFSSRLIEKARLPLKVVAIIPSFNMPRSPFLFPVELADLAAYLMAEGTEPAGPSGALIGDGKGSTVVSGSKTFTSIKLATMAFTSKEIEEDSIVAILPYLEAAVIQAIANALENAVINGVATGTTHMDTDIAAAAATHVCKAWHGLRYYALSIASGGTKDAAGAYINSDANWRDYVRAARKLMGEPFKANNAKLAMIVTGNTAIDIGSAEAFRYAYAFGQSPTNSNPDITGFRPDGLGDFVVSEFHRGDVDQTGVNGAAANTYTTVLQFFPGAWLMGNQRALRVEVLRELYARHDQDAVKVTWRGDLKYMLAGNHTVITHGVPAS